MQKFFISSSDFEKRVLPDDAFFQIKNVLRYKVSDRFLIGVEEETYLVQITEFASKEVKFEIIKKENGNVELPFFVSLFQGYPKGDKLENIIKYGTQLGVSEFYPTLMKRSIVRIEENKKTSKLIRFNKIAKEAAEQSLRNRVPRVVDIVNLKQIDFTGYDVKLLCYEETAKELMFHEFKPAVKGLKKGDRIAVIVGPEGGLDEEEVQALVKQGFIKVGLGPRILRTETVVFYVLSALSYEWELEE